MFTQLKNYIILNDNVWHQSNKNQRKCSGKQKVQQFNHINAQNANYAIVATIASNVKLASISLSQYKNQNNKKNQKMRRRKNYLENSFDSKFITISELAQQDLKNFVDQRFKQQQKLTLQEICMIFYQLLNGLEYIHDQNFIHRDISPQNILVFQDQIIKICDFGFVSYGEQTNANVGKQDFVAPEVYSGNQNYNKSIDIWSLGLTLYYLCTGSTKYNSRSANIFAREQNHIVLPEVYKDLQALFDKMMQLETQNRPSASQLKEELMAIIDEGSPNFQKYQSSLLTHQMNQHKKQNPAMEYV
ncbi:nek [Stylonychia lemnae]|uniref:Nek n=1 Tax=Stylonychia lemnae TaxID=5949 RepID=A0A078AUD5_STYLE|nr:nek [Stylonychia lemnae]|eukprot:CDW86010.1 nek [Stylonychia lemnae]